MFWFPENKNKNKQTSEAIYNGQIHTTLKRKFKEKLRKRLTKSKKKEERKQEKKLKKKKSPKISRVELDFLAVTLILTT